MAKGVEDNAFYRYSAAHLAQRGRRRPGVFAISPGRVPRRDGRRQRDWPHAMTALTTHDTKRSEDIRARIAVLAEMPGRVGSDARPSCSRWRRCPTPGFANLLWQAVVGAWPISRERSARLRREGDARGRRPHHLDRPRRGLRGAPCTPPSMRRSTTDERRARSSTRWSRGRAGRAQQRARRQAARAHHAGGARRLPGQRARELQPGRPRQPAAGRLRRRRRWPLAGRLATQQAARSPPTALRLRRDRPELFTSYAPVPAEGAAAEHVLAFDRGGAVTVATRLPVGLEADGRLGRHRARPARPAWATCSPVGLDDDPRRPARRPPGRALVRED